MTLTNFDCRSRIAETIFDHQICTLTQFGQGICTGDAGGGLTAGNNLIGIISWGISCARGYNFIQNINNIRLYPDVHNRLSWFRSWIVSAIDS
jgi:secreted trypsin-like serine protease